MPGQLLPGGLIRVRSRFSAMVTIRLDREHACRSQVFTRRRDRVICFDQWLCLKSATCVTPLRQGVVRCPAACVASNDILSDRRVATVTDGRRRCQYEIIYHNQRFNISPHPAGHAGRSAGRQR